MTKLQNIIIGTIITLSITGISLATYQNYNLTSNYNDLVQKYNDNNQKYNDLVSERNEITNHSNSLLNKEMCEIYNARNQIYDQRVQPNGFYFSGTDFYCIWAKDRTLTEQQNTEIHEHCHYLVEQDYKHFCIDYEMYKKAEEYINCDKN
jgi:hypothetical protein